MYETSIINIEFECAPVTVKASAMLTTYGEVLCIRWTANPGLYNYTPYAEQSIRRAIVSKLHAELSAFGRVLYSPDAYVAPSYPESAGD